MRYTTTFLEADFAELVDFLFSDYDVERAAMLRCRISDTGQEMRLLVRAVETFHGEDINYATSETMSIKSIALMPVLKKADTNKEVIVFVHSHPGGKAEFSDQDDLVEPPFFRAAFNRIRKSQVHGSIVFADPEHSAGRVWLPDGSQAPLSRIRILGDRWNFFESEALNEKIQTYFDRQVRAFGEDLQHSLHRLTVGVVGAGGTGSPTIEQLLRLGVGNLYVFDDQAFESSNINRVYNSRLDDAGVAKVEIVERTVSATGLPTRLTVIRQRITEEEAAKQLRNCDVVFGCTDEQAGRSILNALAIRYFIPVLDMAAKIDAEDEQIRSITGRVTTLMPGNACLFCRKRINSEQIRWENMHPDELARQRGLGYAPALDEPAPAVITFTTAAAALAVNEFLNRLTGFANVGDVVPSEVLYRFDQRKLLSTATEPQPECQCQDKAIWGAGDTNLFLEMTWPTPS